MSEFEARRNLLKMTSYVPPAILGVMLSNSVVHSDTLNHTTKNCAKGSTIIVSAMGNACCPCVDGRQKKCIKERNKLQNKD